MKINDYIKNNDSDGRGGKPDTKRVVFTVCALIILLIIAVVVISSIIGDGDDWDGGNQGSPDTENIVRLDNDGNIITLPSYVISRPLPINEYSRCGEKTDRIMGIVVHYVGNPGTSAEANRNYFAGLAKSGATYASSNFIIGLDGEVIECVPLGEVAYCSNNRNSDTISIECCHPEADGKFTDATYASLVKLCGWLMEIYSIPRDNVIRHFDVTGKECPLYFVDHEDEWESFRDELVNQAS